MHLNVLLEPKLDLERLVQVLDEVGTLARVDTIRGWSKPTLASLWEAAAGGHRKLTLDDLVPSGLAPLTEVVHHGQLSRSAFPHFTMHFAKPDEGAEIVGYTREPLSFMRGPGYVVARASSTEGEIELDRRTAPKVKPAGWPDAPPSSSSDRVDALRGLATAITIARAKRAGQLIDEWFVLCREDPKPAS